MPPPWSSDTDLVCPPLQLYVRNHNYAHTLAHSSKTTGTIFIKTFDIVANHIKVTNLH